MVRYLPLNSPGCVWCLVYVCLKFAATRVKKESLTFLNFNNKIFSVIKEKLQVLWNFVPFKHLYLLDDGNEFVFDLLYPKCKPLSSVTPTELAAPNCRVCTRISCKLCHKNVVSYLIGEHRILISPFLCCELEQLSLWQWHFTPFILVLCVFWKGKKRK